MYYDYVSLDNHGIYYDRDAFNLPFGGEAREYNVFDLLESACLELSKVSLQIHHTEEAKSVYENFLHAQILWSELLIYYVQWYCNSTNILLLFYFWKSWQIRNCQPHSSYFTVMCLHYAVNFLPVAMKCQIQSHVKHSPFYCWSHDI